MLKYIWMVIQDLFAAVTLATLMHAVLCVRLGKKGTHIHWIGIAAGVISSIALSVVKNTTNKIVSSRWNHKIYLAIILFTIGFLLLSFLSRQAVASL